MASAALQRLVRAPYLVLAAVGLGLLLSQTAAAQAPQGHGIAGFWNMGFGRMPPLRAPTATEAMLMESFPDDVVVLGDTGLNEFAPGDYGGLAIRDALVDAAKDYDPEAQTTVALTCKPPGLIYSMQGPFPIEIFEGRDFIIVKLEYFDLVRVIFMNETAHPAEWPRSQTGHSIGRWEGETLVVDTRFLQAGTLFNNGVDYSEDVHLIEQFRLADANTLVITQLFEDPASFDGMAARVMSFNRGDDHVYPYDCDPTYGLSMDSREGPAGN
jgi:hypothetical protein